jgi:DnaK suppressor protein
MMNILNSGGNLTVSTKSITPEQIHDLQRLLTQRYAVLSRQVDSELHAETQKEVSITTPSDTDWTTADQEAGNQIARVERDANELTSIETALRSIRKGTYGTCIDCGSFIDYPRLVAHPTAARCLMCQEKKESKAR